MQYKIGKQKKKDIEILWDLNMLILLQGIYKWTKRKSKTFNRSFNNIWTQNI